MDIYGYIRLYADIYYYMYMSFWKVVLFLTSGSVIVALYLPTLELSAPTPPIVDNFFGTGLMEMFLRTVGSFYVFGEKLDLTCVSSSRCAFCGKTQISR